MDSPRFDNEIPSSQHSVNEQQDNMNNMRDSVPGNKQGEGAFAENNSQEQNFEP